MFDHLFGYKLGTKTSITLGLHFQGCVSEDPASAIGAYDFVRIVCKQNNRDHAITNNDIHCGCIIIRHECLESKFNACLTRLFSMCDQEAGHKTRISFGTYAMGEAMIGCLQVMQYICAPLLYQFTHCSGTWSFVLYIATHKLCSVGTQNARSWVLGS